MQNKKVLEDFINVQNYSLRDGDKIKLIISEDAIVVDFGYWIFKQMSRSRIDDEDYRRLYVFMINTILFEFKKSKEKDKDEKYI